MALVKCLECGNNISTGAEFCPNCGMVLKADNNIIYDKSKFFIVGTTLIKYIGGDADVVLIPEGIKSLGKLNYVFDYGANINSINLPESLEEIGNSALSFITVDKLTIPRNVKKIGADAFWNCKNLSKIVFENPNTVINQSATDIGRDNPHWVKNNIFCGCDVLVEVTGNQFAISQLDAYKVQKEKEKNKGGCYVATAVYGSYNCPQVWTLRRYRDFVLSKTWYGRCFIALYYRVSPTIVKLFGRTKWFNKIWRSKLDHMVDNLQKKVLNLRLMMIKIINGYLLGLLISYISSLPHRQQLQINNSLINEFAPPRNRWGF